MYSLITLSSTHTLRFTLVVVNPTCLRNPQCANLHLLIIYRQRWVLLLQTGGWIQGRQILQSSMSSLSVSSILKTGPRCADVQTDLWCNLCKPFAPCELENQRQDFRMALGQRLSSLCYLIANFQRLFSFTCSTSYFVFSVKDDFQRHLQTLPYSVLPNCIRKMTQ